MMLSRNTPVNADHAHGPADVADLGEENVARIGALEQEQLGEPFERPRQRQIGQSEGRTALEMQAAAVWREPPVRARAGHRRRPWRRYRARQSSDASVTRRETWRNAEISRHPMWRLIATRLSPSPRSGSISEGTASARVPISWNPISPNSVRPPPATVLVRCRARRASFPGRQSPIRSSFPKSCRSLLIAGMAVLFIAAGWITTRELLIGNPYRGVAVYGAATAHARVPEPEREAPDEGGPVPPAPVVPGPSVVAAAAAAGIAPERLLADIAAELRRGDRRCILVATADRGIDSTTAALALARVLVQEARVVVVDLAFSAPKLAAVSVDPGGPGLADLGRGTASFGQIITRDRNSRVPLVPTGHVGDEASAILESERLRMGIEALTKAYDHVVIDAGPVPDMQVARMAQLASTAVLVASALPEASATANARPLAGGVSDVKVLTCPPLPFGSDAQLAAA